MPTYPSNLNGPSKTVNNVTDLRELNNPVGANGAPDITDPTNTYADVATAVNKLLVELYEVKSQFIGMKDIADPSGLGATTNSNLTTAEQKYIANHFSLKIHGITAKALELAREIQLLQADINGALGASGAQAPVGVTSRYPSGQNRGW